MLRQNIIRTDFVPVFVIGLLVLIQVQPVTFANTRSGNEKKIAPEASNRFAVDLHRYLSKAEGNLFYSPASISNALGMIYVGTEGETQMEMGKVLHVPEDTAAWLKSSEQLSPLFNQKMEGIEITLANRLWGQKDFKFYTEYIESVEKTWQAPLGAVDFINHPEPSRIAINQWVESQTNNRIKDALPQGSIDSRTRLVLTNAIFFKADWASQFIREATSEKTFFVSDTKSVKVPLMYQRGNFWYYENEEIQFLRLPYKAGNVSMELVLPKGDVELDKVESSLTLEQLNEWRKQSGQRTVLVYLPRFKMTWSFPLKNVLVEMGMKRAFSETGEFGRMSSKKVMQLHDTFHKAFVEVNEKGTEATAATAAGGMNIVSFRRPTPPVVFRADHPFLMMLSHQPTGLILFIGRVSDPS